MASNPQDIAFVLVPGGFCPGSFYHKVTPKLTKQGYSVLVIDNPSCGRRDSGPADGYDDADNVAASITELADQGKYVVVVGHSYGGIIITEAAKGGVSKTERAAAGKAGGLVHLVYIGSLLAPVGVTAHELVTDKVSDMGTTAAAEYMEKPPLEHGAAMICSDLSEEEQRFYDAKMDCQSTASFASPLTYAGYLHVPTTVVVTANDKLLKPAMQHESVDAVIEKGMGNVKKVEVISDHSPMLSHPDETVEILLEVAKRTS